MTARKTPKEITSCDSTLLQYESLRLRVLNRQGDFSERGLGLALLIRRGMLAWIEVCHQYIPADANRHKRTEAPVFAHGVTSEMIKVMANTLCMPIESRRTSGIVKRLTVVSRRFMWDVRDYIDEAALEDPDPIICHGKDRRPYSTRHIRRMAKELGKRCGIPCFHTHMLRHSMARWLLEHQYNMSFVKEYLRHKSVRMTIDLYGHFDIEDRKRQAAEGKEPNWVYD